MNAPYQAFRCADGYVTIGANTDRLFQRLCGVLGHPEWGSRPDFANNASRVRNRTALAGLIENVDFLSAQMSAYHVAFKWGKALPMKSTPFGRG